MQEIVLNKKGFNVNFFDNFKKKNLIAAHRGYSYNYPENTMIAFEKSVGKSDLIEFDVQFTKDNIPIIFHDEDLSRTSNVIEFEEFSHRKPYNICDFDYEELLLLDISSWFSKSKIEAIQRIMTLEELFTFGIRNELYLNLEIKDISNTNANSIVVEQTIELIEKYKYEDKILISSFNHEYLAQVKKFNPTISTAALVYQYHPKNLVKYLKELGVCAYHIDNESVSGKLVERLGKEGIFVNVYSTNLKKRKKELFDMGVKMVFSDKL